MPVIAIDVRVGDDPAGRTITCSCQEEKRVADFLVELKQQPEILGRLAQIEHNRIGTPRYGLRREDTPRLLNEQISLAKNRVSDGCRLVLERLTPLGSLVTQTRFGESLTRQGDWETRLKEVKTGGVGVLTAIARHLEECEERGYFFRDVNPQSVLLRTGGEPAPVYILDPVEEADFLTYNRNDTVSALGRLFNLVVMDGLAGHGGGVGPIQNFISRLINSPSAYGQYSLTELVEMLPAEIDRWFEQREQRTRFEAAFGRGEYRRAVVLLGKIDPDYQEAWKLTAAGQVERLAVYEEAAALERAGSNEELAQALELFKLLPRHFRDVAARVKELEQLLYYRRAVLVKDSRDSLELMNGLSLLYKLPPDYKDVAGLIRHFQQAQARYSGLEPARTGRGAARPKPAGRLRSAGEGAGEAPVRLLEPQPPLAARQGRRNRTPAALVAMVLLLLVAPAVYLVANRTDSRPGATLPQVAGSGNSASIVPGLFLPAPQTATPTVKLPPATATIEAPGDTPPQTVLAATAAPAVSPENPAPLPAPVTAPAPVTVPAAISTVTPEAAPPMPPPTAAPPGCAGSIQAALPREDWSAIAEACLALDPTDPASAGLKQTAATAFLKLAERRYEQEAAARSDDVEAARQIAEQYSRANQIDPENVELRAKAQKAQWYYQSLSRFKAGECQTDSPLLFMRELYNATQGASPPAIYRDSTSLYFNCLLVRGDRLEAEGNLAQARSLWSQAAALKGVATDPATARLRRTERTQPPTPLPAVATAAPCSPGGSGSNFFPYSVGGTGTGNSPDQGKANLTGSVVDRSGRGIAGVTLIASAGGFSFRVVTGGNGSYQFGAILGQGQWTVQVRSVPGRILCTSVAASVVLNGQAGAIGTASFTESAPG